MKPRIILDVDDVLNSLTLHILRHYGCDVGPFDYDVFPVEVGYDIITACEILDGYVPYRRDEDDNFVHDIPAFWQGVTANNLWRTAPKSPQCENLLERAAEIVGIDEVYLATTPTKDPQSHADKLFWIWDNLPTWIRRQYFITPRKWLLGKPGTFLFDDHLENCMSFEDESGSALLVPRPWNPANADNTDEAINNRLDEIAREINTNV